MAPRPTNKELAEQKNTTARQISKSRKRGWIWVGDKKVKYTAPPPAHIVLRAPKKKHKSRKTYESSS